MSDARSLYDAGFDHFVEGNLADAVALYRQAIEADPAFPLAWNALSLALSKSGDLDGAIEAGRRLIELEPDDALSHTNLSRLLQQQGKIPEAEDEMAIAMRLQMKQQS